MKSKLTQKQNQSRIWLQIFALMILIAGTVVGNSPNSESLLYKQSPSKKQLSPFEECRKIITNKVRHLETIKKDEKTLGELLVKYEQEKILFAKDPQFEATLLHWAAFEAKPELVKVILDFYKPEQIEQARMNAGNKTKSTPLHMAAFRSVDEKITGHQKALRSVAELFLNCDWTKGWLNVANDLGDTPLHLAIAARNQGVVELLIASKTNHSVKNNDGVTPLHEAAKSGNFKAVWWLLRENAQINEVNKVGDNSLTLPARGYFEEKKKNPDSSLLAEYRKIARLLLAKEIDESDTKRKQPNAVEWLESLKSTAPPIKMEEMLDKFNAAEIAAELAQVDYSQPEPRYNLNIERIDKLFNILESKQSILAAPSAKLKSSVKATIKPSDVLFAQDEDGNTLLHLAAKQGQEDLMILFLVYGGRSLLTRKNMSEETALSLAKFQTPSLEKAIRFLANEGSPSPSQK